MAGEGSRAILTGRRGLDGRVGTHPDRRAGMAPGIGNRGLSTRARRSGRHVSSVFSAWSNHFHHDPDRPTRPPGFPRGRRYHFVADCNAGVTQGPGSASSCACQPWTYEAGGIRLGAQSWRLPSAGPARGGRDEAASHGMARRVALSTARTAANGMAPGGRGMVGDHMFNEISPAFPGYRTPTRGPSRRYCGGGAPAARSPIMRTSPLRPRDLRTTRGEAVPT